MLPAFLTATLWGTAVALFLTGHDSAAVLPGVLAVVSFFTPGFFGLFRSQN